MLKALVYAYSEKTYSSRRIAKALRENVNYMWLSGGNKPDHRMLNNFRSGVLKEVVQDVFASVVELLAEDGYVKPENYFVDGSKIEANANAHKVVWAKRTANHKSKLREKINVLLDKIKRINEEEDPAALSSTWKPGNFPKTKCLKTLLVPLMAAKKTMPGWKNVKSATISSTLAFTRNSIPSQA